MVWQLPTGQARIKTEFGMTSWIVKRELGLGMIGGDGINGRSANGTSPLYETPT